MSKRIRLVTALLMVVVLICAGIVSLFMIPSLQKNKTMKVQLAGAMPVEQKITQADKLTNNTYSIPYIASDVLLAKDIPIKTKDGRVLATAKYSIEIFFTANNGKIVSCILPEYVILANGKEYLNSHGPIKKPDGFDLAKFVNDNPKIFGVGQYKLGRMTISSDSDEYRQYMFRTYNEPAYLDNIKKSDYDSMVDEYYSSWNNEWKDLVVKGLSPKLILPRNVDSYTEIKK